MIHLSVGVDQRIPLSIFELAVQSREINSPTKISKQEIRIWRFSFQLKSTIGPLNNRWNTATRGGPSHRPSGDDGRHIMFKIKRCRDWWR